MSRSFHRKSSPARRVALLIETSHASGRDLMRGIARYLRAQEPWLLDVELAGWSGGIPAWFRQWEGDGIIARIHSPKLARAVLAKKVPAVNVAGIPALAPLPCVDLDEWAIANVAIDHLLARGLKRFAFVAIAGDPLAKRRWDQFRKVLASTGYPCAAHQLPAPSRTYPLWKTRINKLARWLAGLPKPVGVMLCRDEVGPDVSNACRAASLAVPDDVALIGVNNDEPLCELCYPPLSSVWPGHYQAGFEAARLLEQLMEGSQPVKRIVCVPPGGIVVRPSSDLLAVEDRAVARAVRYIREHACEGITVDKVVQQVPASRSVLQRRFRRILRRTIHAEILRVRLRKARQLIAETDLPYFEVASASGFKHPEYMSVVFKSSLGITPARYRKTAHVGRSSRA